LGVLALWSLLACVPLAAFYLWTPAISSRYMMDFAPAFAVAILVAWSWLGDVVNLTGQRHWPKHMVLWIALLGWVGWGVIRAECSYSSWRAVSSDGIVEHQQRLDTKPPAKDLPAAYQAGEVLSEWGIPYNGSGWGSDGSVQLSAIIFVDSPAFLELELAPAPDAQSSREDIEHIRAKVGLEFLVRESVERTGEGWRVRFAGPARPQYQRGVQPVFIATVPQERLADDHTPWMLKQVSWREEKPGE
jgi:hypothetical protein